jgi:hypothetical protein
VVLSRKYKAAPPGGSRDAFAGRVAADAEVAACDERLVEILADVLVSRWDSLAEVILDGNGQRLMDSLEEEAPPSPPVATFGPAIFGKLWRPVVVIMNNVSLTVARQLGQLSDTPGLAVERRATMSAARALKSISAAGHRALQVMRSQPLLQPAVAAAAATRLQWCLPRLEMYDAVCGRAVAAAADSDGVQQPTVKCVWQLDGTEAADRSRARLEWVPQLCDYDAAARTQQGEDAEGAEARDSYQALLLELRRLRAEPVANEAALQTVWEELGPAGAPESPTVADFRTMGQLALGSLAYFVREYSEQAHSFIGGDSGFPFAASAVHAVAWVLGLMESNELALGHFQDETDAETPSQPKSAQTDSEPQHEDKAAEPQKNVIDCFTVDRVNEVCAQTLLRFADYWNTAASDTGAAQSFGSRAQDFVENHLIGLAKAGQLVAEMAVEVDSNAASAASEQDADEEDMDGEALLSYTQQLRLSLTGMEGEASDGGEAEQPSELAGGSIFDMSWDALDTSFNTAFNSPSMSPAAASPSSATSSDGGFAAALDVSVRAKKRQLKRSTSRASMTARRGSISIGRAMEDKKERVAAAASRARERTRESLESAASSAMTTLSAITAESDSERVAFASSKAEVECLWENERTGGVARPCGLETHTCAVLG